MNHHSSEKGQALIIIAFAAIGLFAFAALAIDGSMAFSDKRHAQNAADTAALAGALAHARGQDISTSAKNRALSNGYDDDTTTNVVTVSVEDSPTGVCPANTEGKEITVHITSYVNTTFARVIGREQVTNRVLASTRACGSYNGPPFNGNAIVSLAPDGAGYEGNGDADWIIEGGGIFANSSSWIAAHCESAATSITVPSVTVVGNVSWGNCDMNISGSTDVDATQLSYSDYSSLFPREPACNGTATNSGGQWHPQAGADGSRVEFEGGDMDFVPGLYCVTNETVGPYHGEITGSEVTFYIMSYEFELKFNGEGNSFNASAPTSGEYKGVLMYLAPRLDGNGNLLPTDQALDLRGNGDEDITGTIIAPSAYVTMFGNSGAGALNSQVIAYLIDSGGTADIHLAYNADDNYQAALPITLTLLQ
jgi:Flp pilus assembly protein TadG